ncbi:hypothetical protein [[Mycobacterium] zoologicum]|uniref:Toxin-antitoxin system n=2 Tax=[Mycobacterium] vasticus TaxID=2875777 RepID=A0ABU5Z3G5_9MYCO|nr:hypothetical protein [Mycolicibacter sp. MYC101]MEB3065509.1 hypothetical protein [Mycolicibacter sp. MYC101]MEB3071950.1 hypothetical protein [Mycolicibacter sp. MYC017]
MSRLPEEAYLILARRAREAGCSVSQFVADSMCLTIERPDLARVLGRDSASEELPLAM